MMAPHDESESNRQRDVWKEDRQTWAGLLRAPDDSGSIEERKKKKEPVLCVY